MKKALIITWDGYQDQEVIYPYYRLLEDEFLIDISAEKTGWFYGILGTKMEANIESKDITNNHVGLYDIVVIPGGVKALEKLRQQTNILSFINEFVQSKKIVASTCHGAQLLISANVTKGRKISGYYSIKDDINNSGATYIDAPVVVDGNIVSSPHYKHMGPWMKKAIEEVYLNLADSISDIHP
jgi:protease I